MLVFEARGKPEYPEENLSELSREPKTQPPYVMPTLGIEPGPHWWEASARTATPSRRFGMTLCGVN